MYLQVILYFLNILLTFLPFAVTPVTCVLHPFLNYTVIHVNILLISKTTCHDVIEIAWEVIVRMCLLNATEAKIIEESMEIDPHMVEGKKIKSLLRRCPFEMGKSY